MHRILILGRIPPPVGGVTIHVQRLLAGLQKRGFGNVIFCDLSEMPLRTVIWHILRRKKLHLHISNPYVQLCLAVVCRVLFKKLIITYHGNWGRYGILKNLAVRWSARLCACPIVQNSESYNQAIRINRAATLLPVFIPAQNKTPISPGQLLEINCFKRKYDPVFCSHAWNLTFDQKGDEIYGVTGIFRKMQQNPHSGLLFADPSGNYEPYLKKQLGHLPANVLILREPVDFRSILEISDAYIRNTTTDGSSITVEEALSMNVVVLVTNAVSRAEGCRLYADISKVNLETELDAARAGALNKTPILEKTEVISELISLYRAL